MDEISKVVTQANKLYALSSYEEAADLYAVASEQLASLHGENSPKNADVMFLYGRTLLKVAMQKTEVLGGSGQDDAPSAGDTDRSTGDSLIDSRFSFQGDESFDQDADEEDQSGEPEVAGEGESGGDNQPGSAEDDFQSAWEVLDLARLSFQKQLEHTTEFVDKNEVKKRIADTYDLLGEIALENGTFSLATSDAANMI